MYPFMPSAQQPLHDVCPSTIAIAMDESNVKRILELRKQEGYDDNKEYIESLLRHLRAHGGQPKRSFLSDTAYLEAI